MGKVTDISVVMSVYNGAKYLRGSIDSILFQEGSNFEFIIVNDGSTDNSPAILEEYAKKDSRVWIIHQENQGLTKALIRGCAEAKGEFIARQDCGDVSLPGRLAKQLVHFRAHPEIALLSCWSEAIGPEGERLYINNRHETPEEATRLLQTDDFKKLKGIPHHATAMFSRALYQKVGEYRWQFYYAQDLDLWKRLTKNGFVDFVPEILYQNRILPGSISGCMTKEQNQLTEIISQFGKSKKEDSELLAKASRIRPFRKPNWTKYRLARGNYFIGRILAGQSGNPGKKYLLQAIRLNPFFLKAWFFLFSRNASRK